MRNNALLLGTPQDYLENKLSTSRQKYEARLDLLPQEIRDRIESGVDQLCDSEIYSVVALGASLTSITDLFAPDGAKTVGLRNISNQKIDADKYFLLCAIEILYGVDAANSGKTATFGALVDIPALYDGEFELTQNGRKIVPKQSMHLFFNGVAVGKTDLSTVIYNRSIFVLDNPKFLVPQQELKGTMEWGVTPGAAANSFVKIRLIGTVNERA